ncbi:S-layer homology domain-containing protein [Paenibacillus campi]|uniref:S-layer homology domain-containing protein n=1 Tax=Paenibacillus campi TaxID=3106031 RepID=UPI002AFE4EDE|nr:MULTISPECIES: S-layer homology domain-containing protein [unclassified Paenibacillus]
MNKRIVVRWLLALSLLLTTIAASMPQQAQAADGKLFSDVSASYWARDTIAWGVQTGLVKGYADGSFKPNKTVTEAEFVAMLIRSYEPEVKATGKAGWATPYYVRAKALNYPVQSYTVLATRNQTINRASVAQLIAAADGVNFSGDNAIRYLLAFGLANGSNAGQSTVASFKGKQSLTRAEALQFIKNFVDYGAGGLLDRPQDASNAADLPPVADR